MAAADMPRNHAAPDARRPTVLLVEDEVIVRLTLADQLREAGFAVIEASHADEAWAVLATSTPIDLLVSDIRMPGSMDGLRLAERARQAWPALRIVLVSGHQAQAPAAGLADAFLAKPYDPAELVRRIRGLVTGGEA